MSDLETTSIGLQEDVTSQLKPTSPADIGLSPEDTQVEANTSFMDWTSTETELEPSFIQTEPSNETGEKGIFVQQLITMPWSQVVVIAPILAVHCNQLCGFLYKEKFKSGDCGQCITDQIGSELWYTPSEFEKITGFTPTTKWSWKYSISHGIYPLDVLINKRILTSDCPDLYIKEDWGEIIDKHIPPSLLASGSVSTTSVTTKSENSKEMTSVKLIDLTSDANENESLESESNEPDLTILQPKLKPKHDTLDTKSPTCLESELENSNESITFLEEIENIKPANLDINSVRLGYENKKLFDLTEVNSFCENCGIEATMMIVCSGCETTYCSPYCQFDDFPLHTVNCNPQEKIKSGN